MFLSRIRLDLNQLDRNTLLQVLSGHAYTAHQLLWQLFCDAADRRPFLFRQENENEQLPRAEIKGLPLFYVLSDRRPDDRADWLDIQTKPFEPQLEAGDHLRFTLRANPTIARPTPGVKRSRRSDVMMDAKHAFAKDERASPACHQAMEQAAVDWLIRQGSDRGFALIDETAAVERYRQQEINKRNTGDTVRFSSVDYSGLLQITDAQRFVQSLSAGLGRAKAFGCGLMLIRRAV